MTTAKQTSDGAVEIGLRLVSSEATRPEWEGDFEADYRVEIGAALGMELRVRNLSNELIRFEEALHTYLLVSDVRQVGIEGLPNATCSFTVTVNDLQPPTITSCAPPQTNSANGSCQASVPNFTNSVVASDNCTVSNALTVTQSPLAGAVVGLGTTNITITVKDAANNAAICTTSFTVIDTTPPTITSCAPPQTNSADAGCQAAVPDFTGGVTATDNCTASNALTITQNPLAGAPVSVGSTSITITVKDAANNQATCQTSFTVNDASLPTITCAANVIATEDPLGSGSATVNYPTPTVSDNCSGVGAPICAPPSGSVFPVGTNTATCMVGDAAGNSNSCSFSVIVLKASNPAFRVLSIQSQGSDMNVIWTTPGGRTNTVQATNGDPNSGYSTNFTDISIPIIIGPYGDASTNYVDIGGATNKPARYYRVRLVP